MTSNSLNRKSVLIVGNADVPIPSCVDPSLYEYVAVFNDPRHKPVLPYATNHFLRLGADGKFSGASSWQGHRGKVCVVNPECHEGRRIMSEASAAGRISKAVPVKDHSPRGYPPGKTPSTGAMAIEYFRSFGASSIDIVGFTWDGLPCHAWDFERRRHADMHLLGVVNIVMDRPRFTGRRLAHFFWLQPEPAVRDFDAKMFASVHSFLVHHQGWDVTLWTNCGFSGPLFDRCASIGLSVRQASRVPGQVNISAEVDCLKWQAVRDLGGMVLDISDTVTVGNFDSIYDYSDRLRWSHYSQEARIMGNGWLCINRPGSDIAARIVEAMTADGHRNDVGAWEKLSAELAGTCSDCERNSIHPEVVFGHSFAPMWEAIRSNRMEIPERCRQAHFYYGNVLTGPIQVQKREYLDRYYSELPDYKAKTNIISRAYALSMERAGVPDGWPKGA